MRTAKSLIRLGGCPGWSESPLGAQSLCCFCHVAAHLHILQSVNFWCEEVVRAKNPEERYMYGLPHISVKRTWPRRTRGSVVGLLKTIRPQSYVARPPSALGSDSDCESWGRWFEPRPATFFRGDLVMKIFLRPFSPFRWFKKCSCQLLAKGWILSTGKLSRRPAQEQCG